MNSLAHTKWNCKYHIVFAPKYRRKVFYEEKRSKRNHKNVMPMERCRDNRRRNMPGSHTFTSKYTSKDEYIGVYGIFKREKQFDDISKIWEYEICI